MTIKSKYYSLAEAELKKYKSMAIETANKKTEELYKGLPGYKELEEKIAFLSKKQLASIFESDKSNSINSITDEIKILLAEKKTLLSKNKIPENYTEAVYRCQLCKDTGVYKGKRCECFLKLVKSLVAEDINKKSFVKLKSFESFDISLVEKQYQSSMQKNLDVCKSFAKHFETILSKREAGLMLSGAPGLGKTHLSLSIAKEIIEKGFIAVYGVASDLFSTLADKHFGKNIDSNEPELIKTAHLLIIDDIGAEYGKGGYFETAFYEILNSRLNSGLPTIINTNLNRNPLETLYHPRIISRLFLFRRLIFLGEDVRYTIGKDLKNKFSDDNQ